MKPFRALWICFVLLVWTLMVRSDSLLDPSFRLDPQLAGRIDVVKALPDGKILLGGSFTNFYPDFPVGLIRLHADGTLDSGFKHWGYPPFHQVTINNIELGPDGMIWLAAARYIPPQGPLFEVQTTVITDIRRFSLDGSPLDGVLQVDASARISFLADGRPVFWGSQSWVYSTGGFTAPFLSVGGQRIGPSGNPYFGSGSVQALHVTRDGNLLLGGEFLLPRLPGEYPTIPAGVVQQTPEGRVLWSSDRIVATHFIEAANGTITAARGRNRVQFTAEGNITGEPLTHHGEGFGDRWAALSLADSRTLVTGWFDDFGGLPRKGILALLADGSVDLNFDPGLGFSAPSFTGHATLHSLTQMPDGRILVTGDFHSFDGTPCAGLIRLFPTNPPPNPANAPTVFYTVTKQFAWECGPRAEVRLVRAGETNLTHTIRLTTTEETATAGVDFIPVHEDLVFLPGEREKLVHFRYVADQVAEDSETFQVQLGEPIPPVPLAGTNRWQFRMLDSNCLIRFPTNVITLTEGADPMRLNVTASAALDYEIRSVDLTAIAGRDYLPVSGTSWAGSGNTSVHIVAPDNATAEGDRTFLLEFAPADDGRILGYPSNVVVTIRDNDSRAAAGRFIRGGVSQIHSVPGGHWILSGGLRSVDGVPVSGLARFRADGSHDPAYAPPKGFNISCTEALPDGRLLVGLGTPPSNEPFPALLRLKADGTRDTTFAFPYLNSNGSYVSAMDLMTQAGEVVVAGYFDELGRFAVLRVAVDGQVTRVWELGPRALPYAGDLHRASDTAVLAHAGGDFLFLQSSGTISVSRTDFYSRPTLVTPWGIIYPPNPGLLNLEVMGNRGGISRTFNGLNVAGIHYTHGSIDAWVAHNSGILLAAALSSPGMAGPEIPMLLTLDPLTGNVTSSRRLPVRLAQLAVSLQGRVAGIGGPGAGDTRWLRFNADLNPVNDLHLTRAVVSPLDQSVHLAFDGQAPDGYAIEASADLLTWETIHTTSEINSGLTFIELPAPEPAAARFYRVRH